MDLRLVTAKELIMTIRLHLITINDENIGNHGYIGNLILWIYRIYRINIDGYCGKKFRYAKI